MFARHFADARGCFLEAASAAGAVTEHFPLVAGRPPGPLAAGLAPEPLEAFRAPDGSALSVDVSSIAATNGERDWLIVVSGTHGIEGYVGSAIQSAWLRQSIGRSGLPCGVMMIHALNPFGMAWWSRSDLEGIDLNRNFLEFPQRVRNPGYESLHGAVCASRLEDLSLPALAERFAAFELEHSAQALTNALIGPQSTHPDGLNFTGNSPSWSRTLLETLLDRMRIVGARRVMLVDLHAGVAPRGEIALLHFPSDSPDAERGRRIWASGLPGMHFGAQGLADYSGLLVQGVKRLFGPALHAVVAEIGTVDRMTIREALRLDRWLRHHGDPVGDEGVRERLIGAFCPRDPVWEETAVRRGVELLDFGLSGLLERWE